MTTSNPSPLESSNPRRRKIDKVPRTGLEWSKSLIIFLILLASLWGNASNFDETELRVIRDVVIAMVLGAGVQKGFEKWLES